MTTGEGGVIVTDTQRAEKLWLVPQSWHGRWMKIPAASVRNGCRVGTGRRCMRVGGGINLDD